MLAAVLVIGWAALGLVEHFPDWWQTTLYSVTGSITFVMVFVIQHTQQRQTAAIQRKLDELLRSSAEADSTVIAVEEAPDVDLELFTRDHVAAREDAQQAAGTDSQSPPVGRSPVAHRNQREGTAEQIDAGLRVEQSDEPDSADEKAGRE